MYILDSNNLKVVAYRRKSSEGEDRQVASLEDQQRELVGLAERYHLPADKIVHDVAEAKSAKLAGTRPGFSALVSLIRSGQANCILTWNPDRLSRNMGDVAVLVELLESGAMEMIITPQFVFTNQPLDKYLLITECTRAKLENDTKSKNVLRRIKSKLAAGWRPGPAPIGYLNDRTKDPGYREIIVDPERFQLVRTLWNLLLVDRWSVRKIHSYARDVLRLRTRPTKRQGGRPMSLSHIYAIFRDPFHYGNFWWKNPDTRIRELYQGSHTPMITEDEYWRAQAILGSKVALTSKKDLFAYGSLIKCGECGCSITAEEKWQTICGTCKTKFASMKRSQCPRCGDALSDQADRKVLRYVYYHCTKKRGPCSQSVIRAEVLEHQIDQILACFGMKEKYLRWMLRLLTYDMQQQRTVGNQESVRREKTKLAEELAELNRFIVRQENSGWSLLSREEALAEKGRLTSRLGALESVMTPSHGHQRWAVKTSEALNFACHARLWHRNGTTQQKREILASLGSNLTLKDGKLAADLAYPLAAIAHLVRLCPELSGEFEPTDSRAIPPRPQTISRMRPRVLRRLEEFRTYFSQLSVEDAEKLNFPWFEPSSFGRNMKDRDAA